METKNQCLKMREVEEPYEVWQTPDGSWEWRVLKKWQLDDDKEYARWFCAVKSPFTFGSFEYGDVYVKEIKANAVKQEADPPRPEYDRCNAGHSLVLMEGSGGKKIWDCPICKKGMEEEENEITLPNGMKMWKKNGETFCGWKDKIKEGNN